MSIVEQARAFLEQDEALGEDREARKKLAEATSDAVRQEARRLRKAAYFVAENAQIEARKEHVSPSGAYRLAITPYATKPGSWRYSQGLVYRGDTLVGEVQRNYGSFPFAWVEGHEKGDFLLCGEDYQGQTVINLKTGARRDHLPSSAAAGHGFCWADIHPSPTGKLVAVVGCHWAAPYEVRFYDFADPMLPPWPEIESSDDRDQFFEWINDEQARIGRRVEVHKVLGKTLNELYAAQERGEITNEEYERYGDDEGSWEERRVEERVWVRPQPLEALNRYVKECIPWRQERGLAVNADILQNIRMLIERLSEADMSQFEGSNTKILVDWAFMNPQEKAA